MVVHCPPPLLALVDELLAERGRPQTRVPRFASVHSGANSTHDRDLIPLTASAEHDAFEVNLDSRRGCKAGGAACDSLHGLEENTSWRAVRRPCVRIPSLNRRSLPAGSSFPSQSEQASGSRPHRQ